MYYPSLPEVKGLATNYNLIPVYREIIADLETPVSAFLKINRGKFSFLLESIEGGERVARYSFIGTEPYRVLESHIDDEIGILSDIASELNKYHLANVSGLPRFCGGAVGFLTYESVNRFEDLPSPERDTLGVPEAVFMFVDTMVVFDHATNRIKVIGFVHTDGDIENAYRQAISKIERIIERLNEPVPVSSSNKSASHPYKSKLESNFTKTEFEAVVSKIKDYITDGEAIQVVPSQRLARATNVAPLEIYRALRSINPSPYMYFLDFKDYQIIGASPEILVRVEDGIVMTRPLAGTRRRGSNPTEDAQLEKELRNDEKERAEHIMLVDLGRNDIGRVSEPGSVKVSDLMEVERYSHVMHLVTHVQGKLRRDLTAFDALRACFPAGTVSGAPKIRAMEIIAEVEPEKRGPYAGAVGYFSFSGNMDMAIAIRTMVMKKNKVYIQAGCGVVYDSIPELEYKESLNKAQALLKAIDQAEESWVNNVPTKTQARGV